MKNELAPMPTEVSRRRVLLNGAACMTGIGAILAASTNAALANKLPQTAVTYRPKPNGEKKCSNCSLFEPPHGCKNVAGDISPDGWCLLWRTK